MKILAMAVFGVIWLISCTNPEKAKDNKINTWKNRTAEAEQKLSKIKIDVGNAELIDSTPWVMYPLVLNKEIIKESGGGSSYGSSSSESETYWNMMFYNTETGESHLLDDTTKMIIYNKMAPKESGNPNNSSKNFIFYNVVTRDYNGDGQINSEDPEYLFISGLDGRNFHQISPDTLECESWDAIPGTDKILINARVDINNDKKFNSDDENVYLVYDLKAGTPAKEVFTSDKIMELKKLFEKEWK